MVKITEKIEKMNVNFQNTDSLIEQQRKEELDLKLKEYKTKFEKLVDLVLSEKNKQKSSEDQRQQINTITLDARSPSNKPRLKRSNSIHTMDNINEVVMEGLLATAPDKSQMQSKIKTWLNLKAIESRPMNFDHVIQVRDNTNSVANFRGADYFKRDNDLNGSISEYRSQNADLIVSAMDSPLARPALKREVNIKVSKGFDLQRMGEETPS